MLVIKNWFKRRIQKKTVRKYNKLEDDSSTIIIGEF